MTALGRISTPNDSGEQISALLATALSGVAAALSEGLSKLIRAEMKKHIGAAAINSAVKGALPRLLERSFQVSLLAAATETRKNRITMLHLLTTAEFQNLSENFIVNAPAASTNEAAESLTTEEAAKLLSVSRTHIISLVKSHALEVSHTSGGHRRISKAAVLAYKTEMKTRQSKGLDAIMGASADMGLYEAELEGIPQRDKHRKP